MRVVVLQHPAESRNPLSTVPLIARSMPEAVIRVGLAWRGLQGAVGQGSPREWLVLYLGSGLKGKPDTGRRLIRVDCSGRPTGEPLDGIRGVILLDGTWSQAKTLWWRNPWLLKLERGILAPSQPSRYTPIRKEAKPMALSAVEALALALSELGEEAAATRLERAFDSFLES